MGRPIPRKTVYAATLITILALAGGWTIAAGSTAVTGPAQHSSVTVTGPLPFSVATVGSTQMMTVSAAIAALGPAGSQAGAGHGLNSSVAVNNAVLAACAHGFCQGNYSAVDPTALAIGDTALQVILNVTQPASTGFPTGFDVQVEIIYDLAAAPTTNLYAFGTGYFDTGVSGTTSTALYGVALYIDFGTAATNLPSASDIVVTMNACSTATTCP
jgi:hypothetical protein